MRQIHPVGFHEKFVASGTYTEYFEGEQISNAERWTIHELPDGAQLIRVDRTLDNLLIEVWRNPLEARIERIDINLLEIEKGRGGGKATYIIESDGLQVSYSVSDNLRQEKAVPLSSDCIIFAGISHLLSGFMIAEVARANAKCVPVCLCRYPIGSFDPVVSEVSAVTRESDFLTIVGKRINAHRIQWDHPCNPVPENIQNDPETQPSFWFDDHNTLLRDVIPGMEGNETYLTQYAHRPEPSTL